MDLIKKIKEAEAQAREIVEQARAQTASQAEAGRMRRQESLTQAEQDRKKAIEAAVSAAEIEGLAETDKLKAQAEKNRQRLGDKTAGKMAGAAEKVMDYLRG